MFLLHRLSTTELKAEETPYIAFRADHITLRESILSYGRVDANGMPLLSAFADEDKPSASLPRHVEEYGDSDDHVFYKALQDGKSNSSSVSLFYKAVLDVTTEWSSFARLFISDPIGLVLLSIVQQIPTVSTTLKHQAAMQLKAGWSLVRGV